MDASGTGACWSGEDGDVRGDVMEGEPASGLVMERARISDLDAILALERASFSAPWSEKMLRAEIEGNPFARFVLARRKPDRTLVGYVCYWVVFEELRLMNLAVAPAVRRTGIARALVRRALDDGRAEGVGRALLEVRASNTAALSLYAGFGFHRVALRKAYYDGPAEDAVVMELNPVAE